MNSSTLDKQLPYFRRFKDIVPGHQFIQTHFAEPNSAILASTDSECISLCNGVISDNPADICPTVVYIGITSIDEATNSILSSPGKRQVGPGKKREVRYYIIVKHLVPFDWKFDTAIYKISQINPSWAATSSASFNCTKWGWIRMYFKPNRKCYAFCTGILIIVALTVMNTIINVLTNAISEDSFADFSCHQISTIHQHSVYGPLNFVAADVIHWQIQGWFWNCIFNA